MSYEVFYRYVGGGTSHHAKTAARHVARDHLLTILDEEEVRGLASHVVMTYGGKIILEAATSLDTDTILSAVVYPCVGAPRRKIEPVTLAVYIPKVAADYIRKQGNGSPSEGIRKILIEICGEEMERAFSVK